MKNDIIEFWNNLPQDEKQLLFLCTLLILGIGYALWVQQGQNLTWVWAPTALWLAVVIGRLCYLSRKMKKIQ